MKGLVRSGSPRLATADRALAFMAAYDRTGEAAGQDSVLRQGERSDDKCSERGTRVPGRVLQLPEVVDRTGLSRNTIYVRLDQGRFPRPVSLGTRSVGWLESEVDEWIRQQIAASRDGAA